MTGPLQFGALSPAIAAAAAAALLGIYAPLFLVPVPIVCGIPPSYASELAGGDAFLDKPETIRVSVNREGAYSSVPIGCGRPNCSKR